MANNLQLEFHLPAAPAKVMDMLLDEQQLRRWTGEDAVIDRKEGGKISLLGGWITGEIKNLTDTELVYTWRTQEWTDEMADSEVKYKLVKDNEGTKILLEHSNLPTQEEMDGHADYWEDQFFGLMEEYLWATMKK